MENVMFCKDLLHEDVLQTEKKKQSIQLWAPDLRRKIAGNSEKGILLFVLHWLQVR